MSHSPEPGSQPGPLPTTEQLGEVMAENSAEIVATEAQFPEKSLLNGNVEATEPPTASTEAEQAAAQPFTYNNHEESIFDDYRYFPALKGDHAGVVRFDPKTPDCINHATLKALVVQLTSPSVIDYNLVCDFFLTYRTFSDPHTVLSLLLTRLVWSLQYVNSPVAESEQLGKSVLVRTFVVLRHWILNYFVDDFETDEKLCDAFTSAINDICVNSGLIQSHMAFELKVMSDLKIHWLSQINKFFECSFSLESQFMFATALPSTAEYFEIKRLTKSNTNASIHTNPSFRRSAMLSLYDSKAHHKCIIYDGNTNDENPQLSINNLLSQHKSSRVSLNDKLRELTNKNLRKHPHKKKAHAPKHNYSSLMDSSLVLKKTAAVPQETVQTESTEFDIGFSTNGRIALPSSRISTILPISPVKKMDDINTNTALENGEFISPSQLSDGDDFTRRRSIKKIVGEWTKSLHSPDLKSDKAQFADRDASSNQKSLERVPVTGNRVDILSARIVDELEFVIRYYVGESSPVTQQYEAGQGFRRTSARILDRGKVRSEDFKKKETDSTQENDGMSLHDISELNIEKIDNLFSHESLPETVDAPRSMSLPIHNMSSKEFMPNASSSRRLSGSTKRSSFGGRVTSVNWNDEANFFLENSASNCDVTNLKTDSENFDDSQASPVENAETPPKESSSGASFEFDSSDIDDFSHEVADLGIAMSPTSMRKRTLSRLSLSEQIATSTSAKRFSALSRTSGGSAYRRESTKSYVSYDSAFSIFTDSRREDNTETNLKKKVGYHNLRRLANPGEDNQQSSRISASSNVSNVQSKLKHVSLNSISRSSSKRGVRFSTLCALTELPFKDYIGSHEFHADLSHDGTRKSSEMSDSSVFSNVALSSYNSNKGKRESEKGSQVSVAIPGISSHVLKELASIPDETFSSKNPIQYALYKLEGEPESTSYLDDYTIITHLQGGTSPNGVEENSQSGNQSENEVGSILNDGGDESGELEKQRTLDPNYSRSEQEHTQNRAANATYNSLDPKYGSSSDMPHNTEEILDAINNAVTEDAIAYSSDIEDEIKRKPVTPIKIKSRSMIAASSSMNALLAGLTSHDNRSSYSLINPKLVLDNYTLLQEPLRVAHVMKEGSHISFVLSYSSKSLADHFTIIERDMLQEVDWKELIELKWNKNLTPVNSWLEIIVNDDYYNQNKGVNLVIARFNLMVNWVISEILLTRNIQERAEIISRFIHVAYQCFEMQNYATLMQVILALTSEKVSKLKSTWKALPPGDILTLKHLEQMSSPLKNFINIRLHTNQVQPSRGCIPFVGLYLSDLIFNAERPKFVKAQPEAVPKISNTPKAQDESYDKSVTQGESTIGSDQASTAERMINFSRFRTSVHIVKSLSQCIEWSRNYNVAVEEELVKKCLYIKSLDEGEMNFCLEQAEK